MTNKRTLKKSIKLICEELFAEAIAASLYRSEEHQKNAEALLFSIIRMQNDFSARISHPEPGMPAKAFFRDLREQFTAQASELIDQINNL
jgi:hypothetical protein